MYQPPAFREDRLDVQHALIRAHPFGLLITIGPDGLIANPLPFLLDADVPPFGRLRAHLARANPQWQSFDPTQEALVVFQGPQAYVTPSWYETKRQTGKVVPTWNYAVVQARGRLRAVERTQWLAEQVDAMTKIQEAARAEPWAVADAPEAFIDSQLKGIVGLEIDIGRIEGKWKVSQNRPEADRRGVASGLDEGGAGPAAAMAALVRAAGG